MTSIIVTEKWIAKCKKKFKSKDNCPKTFNDFNDVPLAEIDYCPAFSACSL